MIDIVELNWEQTELLLHGFSNLLDYKINEK